MMKWFLRKGIGKFERDWNYDASYMRDMIDVSPRAAWLFLRGRGPARPPVSEAGALVSSLCWRFPCSFPLLSPRPHPLPEAAT